MRVEFRGTADENLEKLSPNIRKRILAKIYFYAAQPNPLSFAKRLTGNYAAYRFRVGKDYRVIFDIESDTINILLIVKREGAYSDL